MKPKILTVFLALILILILPKSSLAVYQPPIGIPNPADYFGGMDPIDDPAPIVNQDGTSSKCPNWPFSETINCYYIDKTHPNATNLNNTYGYPYKPRLTPPEGQLGAGAFVYINDGIYDANDSIGDRFDWWGTGTDANPIWIVGNPTKRPIISDYVHIGSGGNASYIIMDNIELSGSSRVAIDIRPTVSGTKADHIVIRNFVKCGEPVQIAIVQQFQQELQVVSV